MTIAQVWNVMRIARTRESVSLGQLAWADDVMARDARRTK